MISGDMMTLEYDVVHVELGEGRGESLFFCFLICLKNIYIESLQFVFMYVKTDFHKWIFIFYRMKIDLPLF